MQILMTFEKTMSLRMERAIDRAVKAVDTDAFCHGGDQHTAAHIGYDDSTVDQATRRAVVSAAKQAKKNFT